MFWVNSAMWAALCLLEKGRILRNMFVDSYGELIVWEVMRKKEQRNVKKNYGWN
jgi:hypothetical protein